MEVRRGQDGSFSGIGRGWPLTSAGELRRENEARRDRITRLSAAVLRINASLDLDTVLREVIEGADAESPEAGRESNGPTGSGPGSPTPDRVGCRTDEAAARRMPERRPSPWATLPLRSVTPSSVCARLRGRS